jgi:tRNA-2-methylthio-N6-dimethylallyladenosine synthase
MSGKRFYIETYGCQMNFSDTEIVNAIMAEQGHKAVESPDTADIIFLNTCSIRDNAEKKIWDRLKHFRGMHRRRKDLTIGVLGCMAERVREQFLEREKLVDIVVGPDAYRDIPNLLAQVEDGRKAVNVILSLEETYADITPVRTVGNGVSAFVSIMRGCDNMCSFCVVPFTRGRERSREFASIIDEVNDLYDRGYKEVTFLGQNVNSYVDGSKRFADLMVASAELAPEMRFRFSSPHPKDFPDELLQAIRDYDNLCNYIHIPAQSGSTSMLERMRRPYTREQYIELTRHMKAMIPGLSLSTDLIAGFCGETEEEHQDTLSLLREVRYDLAYMFAYSERDRTLAARKYVDDVPEEVKQARLSEIITLQRSIVHENNQNEIGRRHIVLVEGLSKRSDEQMSGRTDTNKMVIFDRRDFQPGQYVEVVITSANSATLIADPIGSTTLHEFNRAAVTA